MAKRAAKRRMPVSNPNGKPFLTRSTLAAALIVLLIGVGVLYGVLERRPAAGVSAPSVGSEQPPARQLTYEVVNSFPHDPQAFLQGLLWWDGGFYESTGLYGHSTLRRVEFPTGKVIKSISL